MAAILHDPLSVPRYTIDQLESFPDDGNRYELLAGVLLVSPAPRNAHQVVVGRLHAALAYYLDTTRTARTVTPGVVQRPPDTHLEPDILVYPTTFSPRTAWAEISGWWLAVEVLSRSTRVYDRQFKRDAYLALGVAEVWLVDFDTKLVYVSRSRVTERDVSVRERLRWHPVGMPTAFDLDLADLFRDL